MANLCPIRLTRLRNVRRSEGGVRWIAFIQKRIRSTKMAGRGVPRGTLRELDIELPELACIASLLIPVKNIGPPKDFRMVWRTREFWVKKATLPSSTECSEEPGARG